jgi:uncharacterized membrane protein YeiH
MKTASHQRHPNKQTFTMAVQDSRLLRVIDLAGTFVLAIQGASIGAEKGLDFLGVLVISLVTAMGGGIARDLLVGEHPPEALRGWPVPAVALAGGLFTIFSFRVIEQVPEMALLIVDALGLALLAVSGVEKAIEYKLTPIAAVIMGAIAGTGGLTMGEVLLAQIPTILRTDFLASAAILGSIAMVIARKLGLGANWAALLGGAICFVSRTIAILQHWHLPTPHLH